MKSVVGFEGAYCVSSSGDVWSMKRPVKVGSAGGVDVRDGMLLTPNILKRGKGYLRVYLSKDGKKSAKLVHRLVAESFIPNPNQLPIANHKDGDTLNNCADNLEWCSKSENTAHAYQIGLNSPRHFFGEKNGHATLTEDTVKAMRELFERVKNTAEVARAFSVKPKHAYDVCHRRCWKHI